MDEPTYIWSMRRVSLRFLLLLACGMLGCTSIHSKAVRSLIEIESEKIGQADKNSEEFVKATDQAVNTWKSSVNGLSRALQQQKAIESVYSLVFSANQNI